MPSKNRIAAYPPDNVYQRFKDFAKEQKLAESKALNQILQEYFGMTQEVSHRYATVDQVQSIEFELKGLRESISELRDSIKPKSLDSGRAARKKARSESSPKKSIEQLNITEVPTKSEPPKGEKPAPHSGAELSKRLGKPNYFVNNQKRYYKDREDELSQMLRDLDGEWGWRYNKALKKWVAE